MTEEWRSIIGAPGYDVSNLGRVRNASTGRVLKPYLNVARGGYYQVQLSRKRRAWVHTLVLEAFGDPRPDGATMCRHLDGDSTNNRPENLKWGTDQENKDDMVRHGRSTRGEKDPQAKLTAADVLAIRQARAEGVPLKTLASRYGVRESCISRAATGKRWGHIA